MIFKKIMDIGSEETYPSGHLSNFHPYEFIIDNVSCASMEGFLQALKFQDIERQKFMCSLIGKQAKKLGRTQDWKSDQTLYWLGESIPRNSQRYQDLITQAYDALSTNKKFQQTLKDTKRCVLAHTMGSSNIEDTVLTEKEFMEQLTRLRKSLSKRRHR